MADESLSENNYADFLQNLKQRISSAQTIATLSVNRELILLYWQIGCEILERQEAQGWGAKLLSNYPKICVQNFLK